MFKNTDGRPGVLLDTDQVSSISMGADNSAKDISTDLTWVDMLKGIAIIGVFFENWTGCMPLASTPAPAYSLVRVLGLATGPFVQVFFILSGFGLTIAYFKQSRISWSWRRWAWRRITKIVVPYEIAVFLSFILGILGSYLWGSVHVRFSWNSLFAYLTFTRNFYSPSWVWNPPLWFMPVIIGLYACFPILLGILEKWGPRVLLLISGIVTCGTLTIAASLGSTGERGSHLFTFFLFQFALGMVLAYEKETSPQRLRFLIGPGAFTLGIGLMICSWALRTYVPLGQVFNDLVTSIGVFLVLLNLGWVVRARIPAVGRSLNALSGRSYFMYLVHYPIMLFLVAPLFGAPMNPIVVAILGGVYTLAIFFLCDFISRPMNKLTARLYILLTGWNRGVR